MRPILLLLLSACTAPDLATFELDAAGLRDRTRITTATHAELGRHWLDGPSSLQDPVEYTVIEHADDALVLLVSTFAHDLYLTVPHAAAQPVPWRRAEVVADPAAPTGAAATVPPGLSLDHLDHRDGHTLVSWTGDRLAVEGWISDAELDASWVLEDDPEPTERVSGEAVVLAGNTPLLDAPWGAPMGNTRPFSKSSPGLRWVGAVQLDQQEEHLLVRLQEDGLEVTAWVHEEAISSPMLGGRNSSINFLRSGFAAISNVPRGLPLYDAIGGQIVGRTGTAWVPNLVRDSWNSWNIDTPWGAAEVWLAPLP